MILKTIRNSDPRGEILRHVFSFKTELQNPKG